MIKAFTPRHEKYPVFRSASVGLAGTSESLRKIPVLQHFDATVEEEARAEHAFFISAAGISSE